MPVHSLPLVSSRLREAIARCPFDPTGQDRNVDQSIDRSVDRSVDRSIEEWGRRWSWLSVAALLGLGLSIGIRPSSGFAAPFPFPAVPPTQKLTPSLPPSISSPSPERSQPPGDNPPSDKPTGDAALAKALHCISPQDLDLDSSVFSQLDRALGSPESERTQSGGTKPSLPAAIPSVVTSEMVCAQGLTAPSLWWTRENLDQELKLGSKLVSRWVTYLRQGTEPGRVELQVNPQLWSLMDYFQRYEFINTFGLAARDFGYGVQVFDGRKTPLASYGCQFGLPNATDPIAAQPKALSPSGLELSPPPSPPTPSETARETPSAQTPHSQSPSFEEPLPLVPEQCSIQLYRSEGVRARSGNSLF